MTLRKNWILGRFGQSLHYLRTENTWKQFGGFIKTIVQQRFIVQRLHHSTVFSKKAGTGLSSHELNQPGTYRDVSDTTVVAQFKVKNFSEKASEKLKSRISNLNHILAWTTTPWTLPSNTALAVGRDIEYVLVKTFNQYTFEPIIILARPLLEKQFRKNLLKEQMKILKNFMKV